MAFCTRCGAAIPEGARFCPACGAPAGGTAPVMQGQPAGGPAQNSWNSNGNYGGYAPKAKPASSHSTLLRVLSVFFAIGFLVLVFGLGGWLYFNRQVNELVDGYAKENTLTDEELQQERDSYWYMTIPFMRDDVVGWKKGYAEFQKKYIPDRKEAIEKQLREELDNLTDEDIRKEKESWSEIKERQAEKHGFKYTWLIISAYSDIFMIVGGALMVITLAAWLILGGASGPLSQTTILPVLIACCALGIILILVNLVAIPIIGYRE